MSHVHETLQTEHRIDLSYTWVKTALQTAGLVAKASRRGAHRQARPRRLLPGMLLQTDASPHPWIPGLGGTQDLIAVLDDATRAMYDARFVSQESTRTMLAALKAVIETQGLCYGLYVDKASHFVTTRTGPSAHRPQRAAGLTQIERALQQLGIELIPAHSPPQRGAAWSGCGRPGRDGCPSSCGWRGSPRWRPPISSCASTGCPSTTGGGRSRRGAEGTALVPYTGGQLDRICALPHERIVGNDNCVQFGTRRGRFPRPPGRSSFATCRVTVYEHLDGTLSVGYGPHTRGRYERDGHLRPGAHPAGSQAA